MLNRFINLLGLFISYITIRSEEMSYKNKNRFIESRIFE